MSNLVPKRLVDRNGVPTTRMVRSDTNASSPLSIPPPVLLSTSFGLAKAIVTIGSKGLDARYIGKEDELAREFEYRLGIDGMKPVYDHAKYLSEEDGVEFGRAVSKTLTRREFMSNRVGALVTLIDAVPVARRFAPPNQPTFLQDAMPMLQSLTEVNGVRSGVTDPEDDRRAVEYLTFRLCTRMNPDEVYIHNMDSEAKWFEENADALVPYADVIRERGTNFGWLKELVREDNVVPLAEGLL